MFESPLLAPMAPYGSPIRFNQRGAVLLQTDRDAPHTAEESPVSIPINKRLTIKRPPALDAPSPLKREEAKIRDMLWRSPAQEDEDAANADILPPELEQLCPPSPYAAHFDKTLISLSREQQDAQSDVLPVEAPSAESCNAPALARIHSKPGPIGNLNKIPTLVGPNSLPYARCPS